MKVILLRDVEKLGHAGDIIDVSPGYARNFLIPRTLADIATPELIAQMQSHKKRKETSAKKDLLKTEHLAEEIEGRVFEFSAKASSEGKLYASVTARKIKDIMAQEGVDVPEKSIQADHIKTIGEHKVSIRFRHGLEAVIILSISPIAET